MLAVNRGLKWSIHHLLMLLAAGALVASPAMAQINTVDPNDVIDSDLSTPPPATAPAGDAASTVQDGVPTDTPAALPETSSASPAIPFENTYQQDDLIGAAEGVFGKGAQGLAKLIEDILKKQGRPNGYIVGREGGGAFVVGLRYGSGTLNHKVEGQKPVYWTGPSIGPDAGANAGSTFVLVYNLYDTEDIYKRYPAGEGVAYLGGGFNASYLRHRDVVLIPIRVGAGIRLGANVGYMRFSKKQRWLPF
jgi:hypothetical protein